MDLKIDWRPNPQTVQKVVLPVFIVVLGLAIAALYGVLRVQRGEFQVADQSRDVLLQVEECSSLLEGVEAGELRYLLTADQADLEKYSRARDALTGAIAALINLASDAPAPDELMGELKRQLDAAMMASAAAIAQRQSGDAAAALAGVRSNAHAAALQSARSSLGTLSAQERRLLEERSASARSARSVTLATVATVGLIAALLLGLLYWLMARSTRATFNAEARLNATFFSVGDGIITTDTLGNIERMNGVAEQLTGWSSLDAQGQPLESVFQIFNERTRLPVESPFTKVMREGKVTGLANHTLLKSRDGTERPIDDSGAPIRDRTGAISGVVLVFRDATDRYAAERELAESEARFRGTFENAAVGIAHVSPEGRFLRVNETFSAISGYEAQTLLELTFADITHPDDLDADWGQAHALARGEINRYALEKRYRRPDGSYVWVNLTVGLQRDGANRPLFYISAIEDISARRQAQVALRESEARFRDIADATPVLVWLSDTKGDCNWFNSRWLAFTGRSMQQEVGSGWIQGVHPEDLDQCVAVYQRAFERQQSYRTIYRRRRADGQWRTLDASGVPRYIDDLFVGYIGCCIDITDLQFASRALADSEEQLRLATDAAEVGLWDLDMVTNTLFWPARVKRMFGILVDSPVSMSDFYAGLHPDDREATQAAFDAALDPRKRALYDVEYRTVGRDDGKIRWIAAKGRAIFRNDTCVRVIGTAVDITRRKTAETQLRELNEQLERRVSAALADRRILLDIIEATDARVMVLDVNFRILAINRATIDDLSLLFGGVKAKVGDNLLSLLDAYPEQRALAERYWGRALRGEEYTATDEFGNLSSERRYYEMKFNALRDSDGELVGAFQFVYDVTDRLREQARLADAESNLRQTQKFDAIGRLSGGIAHDFNNLLMVISGGLSLLQRSQDPEKKQRILEQMRQATERGASLSRQLLSFARRQPLLAQSVDLALRIEGMREILDRTLRGDVAVKTQWAEDLWPVQVDPAELELVILNLCVNARDAMPAAGQIGIAATNVSRESEPGLKGDFVRLTVSDNGVGMMPEVLSRVFEPFFTTKELGKGSGLGLAQVYGFAQQSGGSVSVASDLGRGTSVHLLLPRSFTEPLSRTATAESGAYPRLSRESGNILLVEDSGEVAALVSEMLNQLGYAVTWVSTAQAALGALEDGRGLDLVFSDVMVPGAMNGAELAAEIRRRRPDLPVLLTTGYAGPILSAAFEAGIPVLAKPYEISELQSALKQARAGK